MTVSNQDVSQVPNLGLFKWDCYVKKVILQSFMQSVSCIVFAVPPSGVSWWIILEHSLHMFLFRQSILFKNRLLKLTLVCICIQGTHLHLIGPCIYIVHRIKSQMFGENLALDDAFGYAKH